MNARHWNGDPGAEHDPNVGHPVPYVCTRCDWTDKGGVLALEHHVNTGHDVRGRRWPASWPNAVFTGVERRQNTRTA